MNKNISILARWFRSQIGSMETPKGSNNIIYNTHYYGHAVSGEAFPWCVAILWDGFRECGLSNLFLGGGKTASVAYIMDWAQRHGCWVTGNYQPGDILCYGTAHAGFCIEADGDRYVTVEGNYSDKVSRVVRYASEITGAYRPEYGENRPDIPVIPEQPDIPVTPEQPDVTPVIPDEPAPEVNAGDVVAIIPGATYWNGRTVPDWVLRRSWIVRSAHEVRVVLNNDESHAFAIMSAIDAKYLRIIKTADEAAAERASVTEHKVQPGDTLWGIAKTYLGAGSKYKLLQEANNLTSTDIYPGQILKIPEKR